MIFLKKLVLVLSLFLFSVNVFAYPEVPEDFYLENSFVVTDQEDLRLLPNTLRLVIEEGEQGELYAEQFPRGSVPCNARWSVSGEGARLFPRENSCTVLGVFPCRETVTLRSENGDAFEISVEVKPSKTEKIRSFDYEEKKSEKAPPQDVGRVVSFLALSGSALLIFAAVKGGGMKKV